MFIELNGVIREATNTVSRLYEYDATTLLETDLAVYDPDETLPQYRRSYLADRCNNEDDKPVKYQIVGQTEAEASKGRISYSSPIGRALIGKEVGDEIEVTVPSGDKFYLVDKIEFI